MLIDAKKYAGTECACIYKREWQRDFLDRLFFYIDGKIRFERACFGESAGRVFEVWASGFNEDGNINWIDLPPYESFQKPLPKKLTDIHEDGNALQFDDQVKRFVKVGELKEDKEHGYGKMKLLFLKLKK